MTEHLTRQAARFEYTGGFEVSVGVVDGEVLAQKTMNGTAWYHRRPVDSWHHRYRATLFLRRLDCIDPPGYRRRQCQRPGAHRCLDW